MQKLSDKLGRREIYCVILSWFLMFDFFELKLKLEMVLAWEDRSYPEKLSFNFKLIWFVQEFREFQLFISDFFQGS